MKKLLSISLVLLVFLFLKPAPVLAGCQMQRADVDSFLKCQQAAPGSTFSFLYYPGDNSTLNQIVAANNKLPKPVNLDIRLYAYGGLPTEAQVNDFLVSLAASGSKTKINARLNNEVNNLVNENIRNQLSESDVGKYQFTTYYNAYQFLKQAGLTDNVSLGIALDHLAPDWKGTGYVSIETTVSQMRAAAVAQGIEFNQWLRTSGITWMMNGYVYPNDPTHYKEGLTIAQVLARLGLPNDIRYAFFEAGANQPGHVSYDPNDLLITLKSLAKQMAQMRGTYNFDWINVLTVNPDDKGANTDFNLLDHPELIALLLDNRGATNATPEDIAKLEKLLKDLGYIHCPNGGIAKTPEECNKIPPAAPPPKAISDPELTCKASDAPAGVFRPFPCNNCHLSLPGGELASGRISTFKVFNNIAIPLGSIKRVPACPELYAVVTWGGTLQLDTGNTTVPFAGYHSAEEVPDALTQYLADYYDGTSIYNGKPLNSNDPQDVNDAFMSGGVFRKLAPQVIQDALRRKMVYRVRDRTDPIPPNNYEIKMDGVAPAHISDFSDNEERIKPLRKDFPTSNLGETEYQIALAEWYKLDAGRWSRLWPAIPMVTREDSPGKMILNIQGPPSKLQVDGKNGPIAGISFPHLGRLKEIIGLVQDIFSPRGGNFLGGIFNRFSPAVSSSNGTVAGIQTSSTGQVLAQDTEACEFAAQIQPILSGGGGNYEGCFQINSTYLGPNEPPQGSWGTDFGYHFRVYVNNQIAGGVDLAQGTGRYIYNPSDKWSSCYDGRVNFSAPAGAEIRYEVSFEGGHFDTKNDRVRDCLNEVMAGVNASNLTCKIGADGKPDLTNCIVNPAKPPPIVCGNQFFFSPGNVDNENALEDSNTQLDVICTNPNPVTAKVTVVNDQIPITEDEYQDAIARGKSTIVKTASREISTAVLIPYLNQIWDFALSLGQTRISHDLGNLGNADKEARSKVGFNFEPDAGSGGADPVEGWLYFPHLGGVQCGKLLEIASANPHSVSSNIQQQIDENCAEYKTTKTP